MDEIEKINEIINWFGKSFDVLSLQEQFVYVNAIIEMVEKIKPIYLKHESFKEGTTFLFKM